MTIEKAYCTTCKRDHYFGFDAVGGRLEFLSCQKGRKPVTSEDAIKTPVSVSGTRYNTLLFHDADGQRIYPDAIVSAINEAAALREQVAHPMVCRKGCGLVDDDCDSAGHPMRPLKEVLKENQALREQVAEHAERVEHLQAIIANTPSARDLQNSTLGQLLTKRNAELEQQNAALLSEAVDYRHRYKSICTILCWLNEPPLATIERDMCIRRDMLQELQQENAALREAAKLARELLTSLPYRNGGGGDVELMIEQLTTAIGAKP